MEIKIDEIVKQVLSEIGTQKPVQTTFTLERIPALTGHETGRTAVLTEPENYELKNYMLPEISEKEVLVQVEGCMVSPADVAEFLKEKRSGAPAVQGQEGTGVIVKLGSGGLKDARGKELKVGDQVVSVKKTGIAAPAFRPKQDNSTVPNGWFSNYVVLPSGSQIYQVNELDQESRLLVNTVAAVNNAVERTIKLCKLDAGKSAVVLGCGMEGLIAMAILKCHGIEKIVAIDDETQLNCAKEFGAKEFIGSHGKNGVAGVLEKLKEYIGGPADAVFHCTTSAVGRSAAKRFAKDSGTVCELGYVLGKGRASSQYYEESLPVGGRFYAARDYEACFALLETAAEKKIPMYKLITHRFMLDQMNEAHWTAVREEGLGIAVFNR